MAVRVPRVATEAVIAALLIGAGCFMLLDLSGKQASTAVGGATFSAKLQGKFMQLATAPKAILPVPCTDAEAAITGLPGVCNLLNGQQGCCSAASLNARLLPDLANCSSRCQSYYTAFYCYFSCKQGNYQTIGGNAATVAVCRPELQTLFNACNTQTCKVLNTGAIQGGDVDFNSFIDTNLIRTGTTAEGCADFTQFGRRCEETAAPTVRSLKVTNTDDDSAVTSIADGTRPFVAAANGATPDATYGYPIRVCTEIVNQRPQGCTTQPPGVSSPPLSANIVVEATGSVAYTVANVVISSQDLVEVPGVGGQPPVFRGCVDVKILPLNTAAYTLTFSASAVNTFGTGNSAGLNANTNTLTVPVAVPTDVGSITGDYALNADLQICQTAAAGVVVGSNSFYAPLVENGPTSFTVNSINCCEAASAADANTGDNVNNGFRAECIINGQGTASELRTTTFTANTVSTTIRLVTLVISTTFTAQGSILLVNAKINIASGATFDVAADTALRGGTGTSLNLLGGSTLAVGSPFFLITLGSIDVNAQYTGASANVNLAAGSRYVVAETSRLISNSAQYDILDRARLVQYTQSPGGISLFSRTPTNGAAVTVGGTAPESTGVVTGVVAVSGTYVSYNDPTGAGAAVQYNPIETRISTARGPDAPSAADEKGDNNAVPTDAEVPGEGPTTFQRSTEKKFQALVTPPVNSRATLQLCGTANNVVTIPSQGTLLVSPPTNYAGVRCQVTGLATHSLDITTLNVAAGGIISITNVDGAFLPIRVRNTFNVAQGANIRVTLAAGINTGAIPNLVLFDTTGATTPLATDICTLIPNIEIINQGNRVVTPTCTATGIALTFSAVQAPPPPQFNAGLFTSGLEYCLLLRQSVASFDRSSFLLAIDNNFGPETTRAVVAISAFNQDTTNADNIRVTFRCYDYSSVGNADLRCSNIVNSASQGNSGFRSAVLAVGSCGTLAVNPNDNDDSNHGLYGLFGLVAIPIILLCLVCLLIRQSRRRADNQYMQDAATFSNVASGPQPLATAVPAVQYDVAKEIYPAVAPAIAYPAY